MDIKNDTSGGSGEPSSALIDKEMLILADKSAMPNSLREVDDIGLSIKRTNLAGHKKQHKASQGLQKMITPIFNVI